MAKGYTADASSIIYDQQRNNDIADHLEAYAEAVDELLIVEGQQAEKIEKAMKVLKKACKNLRKGKVEKVFDLDAYEEYLENHSV